MESCEIGCTYTIFFTNKSYQYNRRTRKSGQNSEKINALLHLQADQHLFHLAQPRTSVTADENQIISLFCSLFTGVRMKYLSYFALSTILFLPVDYKNMLQFSKNTSEETLKSPVHFT